METDSTHRYDPWFSSAESFINRWGLLLLLLLASVAILAGLGQRSLQDWDEAIYAQVAREMIQSGDWIHLHYGYAPYFEKPPLLMWMIAICYKLFGINEFATRLPSAISGVLLVGVTYLNGRAIYGQRSGLLAGLILLSSYGFMFHSRNGTTNMPLTLLIMTGILAYLRLRNGSQKWWFLVSASFALAFMVKIWAALVLPAAVFLAVILDGKLLETLRSKSFWLGLVLAGGIIIPWHVLAILENGQTFINAMIGRNLVQRTLTALEGHTGSTLYYLDILRLSFSPWYFLTPFAVAMSIKEFLDKRRSSAILLFLIFITFAFYTFVVNTKIQNYILPLFPALAILIAYLFTVATSSSDRNYLTFLIFASLMATTVTHSKVLPLCIIVLMILFLLIKAQWLSGEQIPLAIIGVIFVVFAISGTLNYVIGSNRLWTWTVYEPYHSPISQIASIAQKHNPSRDDSLLGFYPLDEVSELETVQGPAATFYSNRPVIILHSWEELTEQMKAQGSGEILIAEKHLPLLSQDFIVSVIETVQPFAYAEFIEK